jgi:hypothetical protein
LKTIANEKNNMLRISKSKIDDLMKEKYKGIPTPKNDN